MIFNGALVVGFAAFFLAFMAHFLFSASADFSTALAPIWFLARSPSAASSAVSPAAPLAFLSAVPMAFLPAVGLFAGLASADPWSPDLCARPVGVGSSTGGTPFTVLAEEGATVSGVRFYRNNGDVGYLRGLVVFFSDGSEVRAGVRKDQFSDFRLSDGETLTGMTLWRLRNSSTVRVARIDIATSSRSWGFGVDSTSGFSAVAVDVASGVLVGFQGRAGDDLDQLAPIFLKKMSSSTVEDIVFEKFGPQDGLRLVTLREGTAVWNGTDYSWTFSGTETRETSTAFSIGSSSQMSLQTTFAAAIPMLTSGGIQAQWQSGTSQHHDSSRSHSESLTWSTTIALSSSVPAVSCSAMVWEGHLNLRWTGTQMIGIGSRRTATRVSGTLTHVAYGKVETVCRPLSPPWGG